MILTFKLPQFEGLIKNGTKIHTIRDDKHDRWKVGNTIQFWIGNPRNIKAKPYQFGERIVSRIEKIEMTFNDKNDCNLHDAVNIGGVILDKWDNLIHFAKNGGFERWEDMRNFFDNSERKYEGKLIFWKDCKWK